MFIPNLKICGITTRDTACFCAEAGAGALGAVFYKKSPRYVTPPHARMLFEGLPRAVARVGVFVDTPSDELLATAREAQLDTIQLHGNESLIDIEAAQQADFHVIKVLKVSGRQLVDAASQLPASVGILVECGKGTLPGGNGSVWNWADAALLATVRPFALAGGLTPQNLVAAASLSKALAWDISSGVENAPGIKDHAAILKTLETLTDFLRQHTPPVNPVRFWAPRLESTSPLY